MRPAWPALLLLLLGACASQPDQIAGDYMFGVDARATDAAGSSLRDVRVSIQLVGPPAYDVITPVSEQVGYTNSEGTVRFFFISHEPSRHMGNLVENETM